MLDELEVVLAVAPVDGVLLGICGQPLQRVLPDRLEHQQAGGAVGLPASVDQALGDQRLDCPEVGAGNRPGGFERRAAGEHREA